MRDGRPERTLSIDLETESIRLTGIYPSQRSRPLGGLGLDLGFARIGTEVVSTWVAISSPDPLTAPQSQLGITREHLTGSSLENVSLANSQDISAAFSGRQGQGDKRQGKGYYKLDDNDLCHGGTTGDSVSERLASGNGQRAGVPAFSTLPM